MTYCSMGVSSALRTHVHTLFDFRVFFPILLHQSVVYIAGVECEMCITQKNDRRSKKKGVVLDVCYPIIVSAIVLVFIVVPSESVTWQ